MNGKTLAENLRETDTVDDQPVVYNLDAPRSPTGGLAILRGNLAPDGAVIKVAGHQEKVYEGPARVFDQEEAAFQSIQRREVKPGDIVVIRYEGPKGGPGMREMLAVTSALIGQGLGDTVAPDYRWPVLRSISRPHGRPRSAGGHGWRSHRTAARGRHHQA